VIRALKPTKPRGGRRYSRSPPPRSSATSSRPTYSRPQAAHQSSSGMFGGFGSALLTGMAFGAGSQMAHQAIRGVTSDSNHSQPVDTQQ
jgi:uncharacterized MAPEG superfamily protein